MTRRVCERPRMSTPKARQENGVWKFLYWEEQGVGTSGAVGGQKAQLGHADVLRLVHHAEVERRALHLREPALDATEQARFGQEQVLVHSGGHLGEARPDRLEPVGYTSDDRSATTPGWSDSFLSWWNRLISRRDRADKSSLSATWSITLRPPKPSAAVAIVILGGMASRRASRISGGA